MAQTSALPPHRWRGADALVRSLQAAGVRVVFTLSGNHIMSVYDALLGSGIELVHTRHEAAAVHMADAWARLTGEVGVALVTGGPGHANAVGALYTARMAESPVLLLSGHAPLSQLGQGAFQEMRQAALAEPLTKAAWVCRAADQLPGDLARAVQLARSGRPGPVHLSLPSDALELQTPQQPPPEASAFAPVPQPLAADAAQTLLAAVQRAQRPLILVGPASWDRAGRARCAALQAACGVPVIGMESPRGLADPSLGALAELLPRCDTVLLLGKPLDFTLKFGQAPGWAADTAWLQVDAELEELTRAQRNIGASLRFSAHADTRSAIDSLTALAQAQPAAARPQRAAWGQGVQQAIDYRPPAWVEAVSGQADRLHPAQALRPLQAVLDSHPDAVFIADGGEIGQWAQACLQAPHRLINGVAGAIGASLPMALAARRAVPGAPVIAVMGDGTFGFHMAEIDTAVRCGLPLVAVVGNDARWNAEHQIQLKDYGAQRLIGCELRATRYDLVCAALGGHGELVTEPGQLMPAVQRALASGLPACVNVQISSVAAPQIRRPARA